MKKETILILHGWGLSGSKFDGLSAALKKKGYSVYNPDLPGFGASDTPKYPYRLADYAQFISEFISTNGIKNPIIIGHSFGGRVTLRYIEQNPKGAKAIILTGTPGVTPVARRKLIVFILVAKIGKRIFSIWPLSAIQEKIRAWYYYLVGARDFYRANGVMREIFKIVVKEDLIVAMKSVTIPCALIWGTLDQITPVWIAKKMKEHITGSTLTILDESDHGVSYKQPERFASEVAAFLKTI